MVNIKENIRRILKQIPKNVVLVAATKGRSVAEINEAIDAGITIIGESYIQDAKRKFNALKGKVEIHGIGHLQSNKVKDAVRMFSMIQTIDSERVATSINYALKKPLPVLVQVNVAKEKQKKGTFPENLISFIKKISSLPNIQIKGLMTMGPLVKDPEQLRPYFRRMKQLFDEITLMKIHNVEMKILSMGMSESYKVAIEEGATMIRIGTGIFGVRT